MDIIDLFWNVSQDNRIRDVRERVDRLQAQRDMAGMDGRQLAEENAALRLRLGLLIRLLIAKGVFTAEEFARLIAEAQPKPMEQPIDEE
jgi:hypothetical protein